MANTLILIENPTDLQVLNVTKSESYESKVFSFNTTTHKFLNKENIRHEIAENFLSDDDRVKLYDLITLCTTQWRSNTSILKNLEFETVNMIEMQDLGELRYYITDVLLNFVTIKRIIEIEKPKKIITTKNFSNIVKSLTNRTDIDVEIRPNTSSDYLFWDRIEVKLNLGRIPISIRLSKSTYDKIKSMLEFIVCRFFNLWFDFNNGKKAILLLEFNPSAYPELMMNLSKHGKNIVLLNRRRSAVWNRESINILRSSKCKLLDFKKLENQITKKQIRLHIDYYLKQLEKIYHEEDFLTRIFSVEGYSFWPCVKDVLIETYKKRVPEFITFTLMIKNLFKKMDISCIVSLSENGTTEQTILKMNKNHIPTILLEHGFLNFTPSSSVYDLLKLYPLISDKIAVWGNVQKHDKIEYTGLNSNRILVTGSPRHDLFFKRKTKPRINSQKTILLAPHPITSFSCKADTNLHIRFENLVKNLCAIIKKMPDVKISVKLHPGQMVHNDELRILFKEIDPTIPVYQLTPTVNLIESCDVLINITPEGYDPSTIILESLILNKPTMEIILDDHFYEYQYIKDKAVLSVSDKSDLKKNLNDILFNEDLRSKLIYNGKLHLDNYLVNQGTASEYLANILNSY